MPRFIRYVPLLAVAVLALSACGSAGANSGDAPKLTITSPSNGATVRLPITLTYESSVQLGPTTSGRDHVHVFTDGRTDDYMVVPTTSFQIKDLSPGKHTIGVTLQHGDHSPAGVSAQITVVVAGSGGGPGTTTPSPSPTDDGGYDY